MNYLGEPSSNLIVPLRALHDLVSCCFIGPPKNLIVLQSDPLDLTDNPIWLFSSLGPSETSFKSQNNVSSGPHVTSLGYQISHLNSQRAGSVNLVSGVTPWDFQVTSMDFPLISFDPQITSLGLMVTSLNITVTQMATQVTSLGYECPL